MSMTNPTNVGDEEGMEETCEELGTNVGVEVTKLSQQKDLILWNA